MKRIAVRLKGYFDGVTWKKRLYHDIFLPPVLFAFRARGLI
jgi:hypothetical protein